MRLGLISDLHLEGYRYMDRWRLLLSDLQVDDVDVLVVAGDLTEARLPLWYDALRYLSDYYPRVLYVTLV